MATIDYATKYTGVVSEKIVETAKTGQLVNNDFDFVGTKTIKIYNVSTAQLNDYKRTGTNRYGTPEELNATTEEFTLDCEKSFTFVIDGMDMDETQMALEAGKALNRQIKEVVVPFTDKYVLGKIEANAKTTVEETLTAENIYEKIVEATEQLDEDEIPQEGRKLVCTPKVYKLIKQSKDIILDTDLSDQQRKQGVVGMIDGMDILKVPSSRFGLNVEFIITHANATTHAVKLDKYVLHQDPPGINGVLVEGLLYMGAFVLQNNKKYIYVCKAPALMSAKKSK